MFACREKHAYTTLVAWLDLWWFGVVDRWNEETQGRIYEEQDEHITHPVKKKGSLEGKLKARETKKNEYTKKRKREA